MKSPNESPPPSRFHWSPSVRTSRHGCPIGISPQTPVAKCSSTLTTLSPGHSTVAALSSDTRLRPPWNAGAHLYRQWKAAMTWSNRPENDPSTRTDTWTGFSTGSIPGAGTGAAVVPCASTGLQWRPHTVSKHLSMSFRSWSASLITGTPNSSR
eukprot:scaffold1289_cov274-Pinguiococcus_pyrenoidosus.AAC.14